jgi:hypothetical protein
LRGLRGIAIVEPLRRLIVPSSLVRWQRISGEFLDGETRIAACTFVKGRGYDPSRILHLCMQTFNQRHLSRIAGADVRLYNCLSIKRYRLRGRSGRGVSPVSREEGRRAGEVRPPIVIVRGPHSIFGIGVDRKHVLKWLLSKEKATLHTLQKVYVYSENALNRLWLLGCRIPKWRLCTIDKSWWRLRGRTIRAIENTQVADSRWPRMPTMPNRLYVYCTEAGHRGPG